MTYSQDTFPIREFLDSDWDDQDVLDLVKTTPLVFDDEGLPVGYDATPLLGLEAAHLGRF